jgi:hypothetical protein
MNSQNQNGDTKPGFGDTSDQKEHRTSDTNNKSDKDRALEEKKRERQEAIEDTSSVNYGNIGVEGGVEDLDEEP